MPSVVIPAHNEGRVIGRLLAALTDGAEPGELEVVVVSNGSSDDTADVASSFSGVTVLELTQGSKHLALLAGDEATTNFPRLYIDADIEIDRASVLALSAALAAPGIEAVAPRRVLDIAGCSRPARMYFGVWQQLPVVRTGLFGRGVIAVDRDGYARIADRPSVLGDDLWMHSQFRPDQRMIVESAAAVVRAPRTTADLLRRRTRTAQGNEELDVRSEGATSTTTSSARDVVQIARRNPTQTPAVVVFLAITALARLRARRMLRRGDTRWLRDESSRAAASGEPPTSAADDPSSAAAGAAH